MHEMNKPGHIPTFRENRSAKQDFHERIVVFSAALSKAREAAEQMDILIDVRNQLRVAEEELQQHHALDIRDEETELLEEEVAAYREALDSVTIFYDGRRLPSIRSMDDAMLETLVSEKKKGVEHVEQALQIFFHSEEGNDTTDSGKDMRH